MAHPPDDSGESPPPLVKRLFGVDVDVAQALEQLRRDARSVESYRQYLASFNIADLARFSAGVQELMRTVEATRRTIATVMPAAAITGTSALAVQHVEVTAADHVALTDRVDAIVRPASVRAVAAVPAPIIVTPTPVDEAMPVRAVRVVDVGTATDVLSVDRHLTVVPDVEPVDAPPAAPLARTDRDGALAIIDWRLKNEPMSGSRRGRLETLRRLVLRYGRPDGRLSKAESEMAAYANASSIRTFRRWMAEWHDDGHLVTLLHGAHHVTAVRWCTVPPDGDIPTPKRRGCKRCKKLHRMCLRETGEIVPVEACPRCFQAHIVGCRQDALELWKKRQEWYHQHRVVQAANKLEEAEHEAVLGDLESALGTLTPTEPVPGWKPQFDVDARELPDDEENANPNTAHFTPVDTPADWFAATPPS